MQQTSSKLSMPYVYGAICIFDNSINISTPVTCKDARTFSLCLCCDFWFPLQDLLSQHANYCSHIHLCMGVQQGLILSL